MGRENDRKGAFIDELIDKYADTVYKVAYSQTNNKYDADDVFQTVFLKCMRKHPTFMNEQHEKAWLIRTTVNCCKDIWRSPWNQRMQPLDDSLESEGKEETMLEDFLRQLPPKYRLVIHLFYYEEMSVSEIGRLLKKKESTVKMQLTRARRLLKEFILKGEKENVGALSVPISENYTK